MKKVLLGFIVILLIMSNVSYANQENYNEKTYENYNIEQDNSYDKEESSEKELEEDEEKDNAYEDEENQSNDKIVVSKEDINESQSEKITKNIYTGIPTQTIEDGEYEIRTAMDNNKIFDIGGGSINSGAKLQIWYDSNVEQQRFIVKYIGDGYYKITVKKSNKVLDVTGAGIQNGTSVQQYDSNNTDAQKWIIKETEDGYYNIISKCNGLYTTAVGDSAGASILMYEYNNSNSQKFIFDKVLKEKGKQSIEDGEYEIRTAMDNNKIFDIGGGSINSGAKLQIWYDSNVEQQRFIVKYIGDGYYKITVRKSNKVLDVAGAGIQNGTSVQQYDSNNTDAQKWIIKETEDGYYNIISKCNGLYTTVVSDSAGASILMYEDSNSSLQKFTFEKIVPEKGKQSLEDGVYEIRTAVNNNKIFDIAGGTTQSGAKLQIWDDSNVPQQRFIVKYIGDGYYKITVKKSEKVLDVVGRDYGKW